MPHAGSGGDDANPLAQIESAGAAPFVTRRRVRHPDDRVEIRHSRHHRKGLRGERQVVEIIHALPDCLWMPREMNWWIGSVFSIGASLFALGSILFLFPALAAHWAWRPGQISWWISFVNLLGHGALHTTLGEVERAINSIFERLRPEGNISDRMVLEANSDVRTELARASTFADVKRTRLRWPVQARHPTGPQDRRTGECLAFRVSGT